MCVRLTQCNPNVIKNVMVDAVAAVTAVTVVVVVSAAVVMEIVAVYAKV